MGIPTADPLTTVTVRAEDVYGNAGKDLTLRLRYVNESDTVPYVLPSPHVISTSKTLSVDVAVVHAWGYAHFELEPVHPDPTEPARAGFGSLGRLRVPGQIGPVTDGRGTVSFTAGLLEGMNPKPITQPHRDPCRTAAVRCRSSHGVYDDTVCHSQAATSCRTMCSARVPSRTC